MDAKGFSTRTGRLRNQGSTGPRGDAQCSGAALLATRLFLDATLPDAFVAVAPQASPQPVLGSSPPKAASAGRALPQRQESSTSSAASAAALGLGAAMAARACARASKVQKGRLSRDVKVFRRQQAVKEKVAVLEMDPDQADEIRRLELEAAKLRADVQELEAVQQEEERRRREALFRSWDLDSSGTLDEQELQIGLKEECKVEIDDEKAKRLLKALDDNGDGVLQNEEFCLTRVEKTLQKFRDEELEAEAEARRIAALEREKELAEREKEELMASLPERNEDTSLPVRLMAAAAYLLPLLDASRFGVALTLLKPELAPFFSVLMAPMTLLNAFPFGLGFLAIFFTMQSIAADTNNPALIRFNMRQAIQLDVMLFVPVILGIIGEALQSYWEVELTGISAVCSGAVFLTMLTFVLYSVGMTLLGEYPQGIPIASENAEMVLKDTRPSKPEAAKENSEKES